MGVWANQGANTKHDVHLHTGDKMEEVMSHLKWEMYENLHIGDCLYLCEGKYKCGLVEYDNPELAEITYEIITQWEEQHNIDTEDQGDGTSAMCQSISYFFHVSQEYDNHNWLIETIAKRSNGAFATSFLNA